MDKYTRNDFEENYQQPDTFQESFVGRVDLSPNENGTPFFVQDKIDKNEKTNYSNAMQGLMENSLLSITFFSAKNIESIQNTLRSKIFNITNGQYKIDVQDNDQLKIIMRSVFLQYSSNNNDNIDRQIRQLNTTVLDYAVPQVHNELVSYIKYKRDISSPPSLMQLPQSLAIDKTMELNNFF